MATSSRTGCVAEVAVTMTSASLTHSSTLSWTRTVICVDALRSSANLSAPARFRFHRLIWAKIYRINQPFPVAQSISSSLIHYPPARYLLAHSNSFLIFSLSNYIRTNRNDVNYIQPIQKKKGRLTVIIDSMRAGGGAEGRKEGSPTPSIDRGGYQVPHSQSKAPGFNILATQAVVQSSWLDSGAANVGQVLPPTFSKENN